MIEIVMKPSINKVDTQTKLPMSVKDMAIPQTHDLK